MLTVVSKLNSAVLGHSKGKGKGQKAAKGGAKDVTASASKKKKPVAVVEEVRFLTGIVDDFRRFVDEIWRF